jgi:hypothetical protein
MTVEVSESTEKRVGRPPVKEKEKKKYYKVVIHQEKEENAPTDQTISVNGEAIRVMKGEEVEIPELYYLALKDAVETHFSKDENGNDVKKDIPRFPFTTLGEVWK